MLVERTENMNHDLNMAISTIENVISTSTGDQMTSALASRLTRTFVHNLLSVNLSGTEKMLASMSDYELLAHLVMAGMDNQPVISREARVRLQGHIAFRELLSEHGGVLSQQQTANMLGITPDGVRKRASRNKLLAVKQGEHLVYPVFQFGDNGDIVPDFDEVLRLLDTRSDVAKVRFFISYDTELDKSVIDVLKSKNDLAIIFRKARQYGKQGGT